MNNYIISCCSTADLSKDHFESRGIHYICFHYYINNIEYPDDLGQTMPFEDFYKKIVEGADTRTSQINPSEYEQFFSSFLDQGLNILHVTLSTGISGTYTSAQVAAHQLKEKYPDRKIYIIDSLGASSGYGLLMDKLADLRDEGMDIDTLAAWTEEHKLNLHHWFFSTDLTFYIKGGRISKSAGFIGTMLNICPLLNMDNLGRLIPRNKIRGKKKVIKEIVDRMQQHADDGLDYSGKCYISMSDCYDDAKKVAELIEERFPKLNGKVEINWVGTTIGSHTGPGTVALFFWGDKRVE